MIVGAMSILTIGLFVAGLVLLVFGGSLLVLCASGFPR